MEIVGKMSMVIDKAKVSGIVGAISAFATVLYGYVNFVLLVGIGVFLLTMMIQYGSVKIKLLVPAFTAIIFLLSLMYNGGLLR
jgi:hypothetical protein